MTTQSKPQIVRLGCPAQQYAWGKLGMDSAVARMYASGGHGSGPGETVAAETPYAELWMGAHPKAPARVAQGPLTLAQQIAQAPARWLGTSVAREFDNQLPFLFKVLSVRTALSIQAHPDKALAAELHAARPEVYPDPNHKPEMVIALTEFEALVGLRRVPDLVAALTVEAPELGALVGAEVRDAFVAAAADAPPLGVMPPSTRSAFERVLANLMAAPQPAVEKALGAFLTRTAVASDERVRLVRRLNEQYPGGDVGCFTSFFLNLVTLHPGDAAYLLANEPHAYLSGDCVECMAASDNVVRAGLTPKLRDAATLVRMLSYRTVDPSGAVMRGESTQPVGPGVRSVRYSPPIPEFSVLRVEFDNAAQGTIPAVDGPRILLVAEAVAVAAVSSTGASGELEAPSGSVFFIPTGLEVCIRAAGRSVFFCAQCAVDSSK